MRRDSQQYAQHWAYFTVAGEQRADVLARKMLNVRYPSQYTLEQVPNPPADLRPGGLLQGVPVFFRALDTLSQTS